MYDVAKTCSSSVPKELHRKGPDGAIVNYPCWELVDSTKNRLIEEGCAKPFEGRSKGTEGQDEEVGSVDRSMLLQDGEGLSCFFVHR